jgi:hypothetical protein
MFIKVFVHIQFYLYVSLYAIPHHHFSKPNSIITSHHHPIIIPHHPSSSHIISPYVHVIKVLLRTASCGISQDRGKRSFGATGSPEFSTSTQKEEKGGGKKREPK